MRQVVAGTALTVLVLTGCGADVVTEGAGVRDEVASGLEAWRSASAQHARVVQAAAVANGLAAWRAATIERAPFDRLAEIEQLRAQSRAASDRLRVEAAETARSAQVERLRAEAKVDGGQLRSTPTGTELAEKQAIVAAREAVDTNRIAEIERLRAEAKVAGDTLRFRATTVLVWTDLGPDEDDRIVRVPVRQTATASGAVTLVARAGCISPRVMAGAIHRPAGHADAKACPVPTGLLMTGHSPE